MSRSYRKNVWACDRNPWAKRQANKRVRKLNKHIRHILLDDRLDTSFGHYTNNFFSLFEDTFPLKQPQNRYEVGDYKHYRKFFNPWDICDWKFYVDESDPYYHQTRCK